MAFWDILPWRRDDTAITEAKSPAKTPDPGSSKQPERAGYLFGVPEGGLDEIQAGMGASTGTDRKSMLQELYEAYLACPWSWSCVNAIARTVTSGGLVTDWDADTGEGDQEAPDKPPEVLALEAFLDYCNPTQDIRQVLRNVVSDLEVFGGAYLEVAWWGSTPVAIWNQDFPTTTPITDVHGAITGYVQTSDYGQRAEFEPKQIIYISLDSARAGVFGISPTQAGMGPITAWLFAASTGKEIFRKGLPANVHVDLPPSMSEPETRRWSSQYMSGNLGAKNIGRPIVTRNGGKVNQLQAGKVPDVLSFLDQKRDEIIACVIPGTKIITSLGLLPIEEMQPGMRVLTHAGRWKRVTEILVNPAYAPVMEIQANGFDALNATSNHPVWAAGYNQDRNHHHHFAGHSWVPAGELKPRLRNRRGNTHGLTLPQLDFAGSADSLHLADHLELGPRNTGCGWTAQSAWDDGEFIRHSSTRVYPIPSDVKMTREFGRLLGLYLAEGHIINDSGVCWSFHEDETHLQDEVRAALANVFGLRNVSFKHVDGQKCVNVYVRNVFLAELFKCGKALTKRLPEWAWTGGAEFMDGVLSGWADGDGHLKEVNGIRGGARMAASTKSETLAWQMRIIATTLGLPAALSTEDRPATGRTINGKELRSNGPAYVVSWPLDPQREGTYRIEGGTLTSPVRSVEETGYTGVVYNLEVEDDHSYVTTGGAVHNCYGVPPAKAGVIESGNLGGGTGDSQDRTYRVDTCGPIGDLILEKLNYHLTAQGFGVSDWKLKFGEVDYRDSLVIEQIRDMRLRNGTYTRNKYAAEIGEPSCDGGDDPVLVDRQNLVLWQDMSAMSKAIIAGKGAPAVTAGETPPGGEQMTPDGTSPDDTGPEADDSTPPGKGKGKAKGTKPGDQEQLPGPPERESWQRRYASYRKRFSEALDVLPPASGGGESDDTAAPPRTAVQPPGDQPGPRAG